MKRLRNLALPLLAAVALVSAASVFAACGSESHELEASEGHIIKLGELEYNVIFSRFLNLDDNEDSAYLVGQPAPKPGSAYFGVFVEVQNPSKESQPLPDHFTIHDADKETYDALESESLYAFPFGGEVEPEEQIPVLDSTAFTGPIEGSLILFELPAAASEARPLILEIPGPGGPGEVTLDL